MATNPREADWDGLMELAGELEPLLAAAFLETVERLRTSFSLRVIEEAITSGQLGMLVESLAKNPQAYTPLSAAVQTAAERAAIRALDRLPARIRAKVVQPAPLPGGSVKRPLASVRVVFDGYNPRAVEYIRAHGSRLIVQVTDGVRGSVNEVVTRGIKEGTGPAAMARDIRAFIGLTERQQRSLINYRRMLENQDSAALERALRDLRHDPKLIASLKPGGRKLTAAEVDQQVEAMRQKTLTYRAETIARTESITALNTGQKAAWAQVVSDGGVQDGDVRRFWHTARDERTCPVCLPIPRMNPDGVGLDEFFKTPDGPVDGPTMHPKCRCTVFVEPFFRT